MEPRPPEDRDEEQRALGILEHGLQVTHDRQPIVLNDGVARNALTEWRPLAEAAEKSHQSAESRGGRRRRPEYKSRRRLKFLWVIPLLLIWAAAAYAVYFMLNNGQV